MFDVKQFVGELHDYIGQAIRPLQKRIDELESRAPEKGEKGEQGPQGEAGPAGKDADPVEVSHDDILLAIKSDPEFMREIVADYLKDNPPVQGPVGETGPQGEKGEPGKDGVNGERGEKGDSGVGVSGALIDQQGHLILTLSSGEAKDIGPVKGKDGRDGFSLEDFSAEYDGERGLVLRFTDANVDREFKLHLPIVIHRGFWSDGQKAKAGDAWTHAGSLWIAKRDTSETPGYDKRDDWIMAARKGRDGEAGKDFTPPKPVNLKKKDDD